MFLFSGFTLHNGKNALCNKIYVRFSIFEPGLDLIFDIFRFLLFALQKPPCAAEALLENPILKKT